MKAAVIHENGGLDQVLVEQVEDPKPGPGQALIDVHAAALNHLDIWVRKGRPGITIQPPHILGCDAAGVVARVGEGVDSNWVGKEVVLFPAETCGRCEACQRGEDSQCDDLRIFGAARPGAFAERIVVPVRNLHCKPPHLSMLEAAALPVAYITAWHMLVARAQVRPGEWVLIHGIGGGVAIAALQFAKLMGAGAIVTSSSQTKLETAHTLGADHGINYMEVQDVATEVKAITGGRGVDVAIDAVGAATWPLNFAAVRRGGRIVHCGVTTGAEAQISLAALYRNHLNVLGSMLGTHEDFRLLLQAMERAMLKPVVDSVHKLKEARHAMARMEEGLQFGKIVLEM